MPGIAVRRTASLPLAYVPGIHVFAQSSKKDVDGRGKPGHDSDSIFLRYRCGMRSKLGMPSGMWWNGCLSIV